MSGVVMSEETRASSVIWNLYADGREMILHAIKQTTGKTAEYIIDQTVLILNAFFIQRLRLCHEYERRGTRSNLVKGY
jgi:hypothetical protein